MRRVPLWHTTKKRFARSTEALLRQAEAENFIAFVTRENEARDLLFLNGQRLRVLRSLLPGKLRRALDCPIKRRSLRPARGRDAVARHPLVTAMANLGVKLSLVDTGPAAASTSPIVIEIAKDDAILEECQTYLDGGGSAHVVYHRLFAHALQPRRLYSHDTESA